MKYNKLIIFDLDGVLIESRDLHFEAFNMALASVGVSYIISKDEHLSTYDGLPTSEKLKLLTKNKGLPPEKYDQVWNMKQKHTLFLLEKLRRSDKLIEIMEEVKKQGYLVSVASNSVRKTIQVALEAIGVSKYVDYVQSNEDVLYNKPYPEMYWNCMRALKAIPETTIIIEDSHIGREGAMNSKAHLLPVENSKDLTLEKILSAIGDIKNTSSINVPWRDKKLNVVIPMAGLGSRFSKMGYTFPKPLIEVRGKPMIQVVKENLNIEANYIFIVQKEHYEKYNLQYLLNLIAPGCKIVQVDGVTEGAACTVLLAQEYINNENPLLIVNSDQFVEWNSNEVMYAFTADNIGAGILTFKSTHPKYSFVKLDEKGFVSEVAEKKVISDNATVGIYYWKEGQHFVKFAKQMIDKNIRVNGEFYVAPVFNEAIEYGLAIRIKEANKMWSLGTPEDLTLFLSEHK